jgi:hypothetical protein
MNKIIPTAAALALAFSLPGAALAQNQGQGRGGDQAQQDKGGDRGPAARQDKGGDRARNNDDRGRGQARAERDVRQDKSENRGRSGNDARERAQDRADREVRRAPQVVREAARRPDPDRRARDDDRRDRPVTVFRLEPDRGLIAGCPPGLAKRNNGCLPPGQERRIERARYDWLWGTRDRDRIYRYDGGYLYRMDRSGSVLGWLPVLGGALSPGAIWPTQYAYQPVPAYYTDYYRLNDPYDYRYANGALYGVDPRTQAITQVVALLTGQPITVGQPMPAGYDVYNVPYPYRARYVDTADSLYRYNDGYVYRVDPTTQLVQAAIQLLT